MRIGIDCRTILDPRAGECAGIGHYTYFLVKHLLALDHKNEYVLFFDSKIHQFLEFIEPNDRIVLFPFSRYKKYLRFSYSHFLVSAALVREKLDVFHAPANTLPLSYSGPSVVTVHDLAIYDHPEWFPGGQSFSVKTVVPNSLAKARKIIAVSQATKEAVMRQFHISRGSIAVIYEGVPTSETIKNVVEDALTADTSKYTTRALEPMSHVAKDQTPDRFHLDGKLIVSISTLEPRKNFVRLIRAFEQMLKAHPQTRKNVRLLIAGAKGWKYAEIMRAIETSKHRQQIHYLGYISHQEKIALLKSATIFAFPTLWEGFGIGNLEAMQAGTPVLTSNIAPIKEVVGDAAYLVDPENVESIANGLYLMLLNESLRKGYIEKGKKQAVKFSWEKCARETLAVYEEVGESRPKTL